MLRSIPPQWKIPTLQGACSRARSYPSGSSTSPHAGLCGLLFQRLWLFLLRWVCWALGRWKVSPAVGIWVRISQGVWKAFPFAELLFHIFSWYCWNFIHYSISWLERIEEVHLSVMWENPCDCIQKFSCIMPPLPCRGMPGRPKWSANSPQSKMYCEFRDWSFRWQIC